MKPDLKNMSRKELERLKANVEKALEKLNAQDRKAALAAAQKAAAAHGFALSELTTAEPPKKTRRGKPGPKTASTPKYRNPANADQTWTGKGRQPEWFKSAIASGTTPEAMEI